MTPKRTLARSIPSTLKGDVNDGKGDQGGQTGLLGEGALALLTLLHKVLYLGYHLRLVKLVSYHLQGVLGPQVASKRVGVGMIVFTPWSVEPPGSHMAHPT